VQWEEVRKLYPNQWVQLEALTSRMKDDKKVIEEVAVIRSIKTDHEATKSLLRNNGNTFVFHTSKPQIEMNIVKKPSYRGYKTL